MLRLAVIVLLLANAGYYAWSQGLLKDWGLAPEEQAEPERLQQQIRPETLQILRVNPSKGAPLPAAPPSSPSSPSSSAPSTPSSAAPAATAEPAPAVVAASAAEAAECLQAGIFDERQAEALRATAAALPAGSWALEPTPLAGRWMVYMGRFDDLEALERKRAELRSRKVDHDRAGGTLEYGLSLGRFSTQEAAERELASLAARNVRTARVVQERPNNPGYTLRLPAVTAPLRAQLDVLRTAMAGKSLRPCT